jgi:hypothetical protein
MLEVMSMTEKEWLTCPDPNAMLDLLRAKVSDRKLRLFAVACCYRIWHLMMDVRSREAVAVVERFADCLADPTAFSEAKYAADQVQQEAIERGEYVAICDALAAASCAAYPSAYDAAHTCARCGYYTIGENAAGSLASKDTALTLAQDAVRVPAEEKEKQGQSRLLRDIFGNPFRPVTLDPSWLTSTVKALAQAIYTDRNFTDLPVLGDCLEESGCNNEDILNHCRGPGEHVKGCWVLDLVLGKS